MARVLVEKMQGHGDAPFAPGFVGLPAQNLSTTVMFLVDTGNSNTALGEVDAKKLGLEPRKLPTPRQMCLGVGGRGNVRVCEGPVIICLMDTDGNLHEVNLPQLNVILDYSEKQHSGGKTRRLTHSYPSLLGRDFLCQTDAVMRFDFKNWDMWIEM